MGWAVGTDTDRRRHIGYGVPAACDYPGCGASIDRGLAYACGGGVMQDVEGNCGLFFCGDHLSHYVDSDDTGGAYVCERCVNGQEPFDPTPDTAEWARHVLADDSWAEWREHDPEWADDLRRIIEKETEDAN